jgi:hypothetical protein
MAQAKIPADDYQTMLGLIESSRARKASYFSAKDSLTIPDPADASLAAAHQARDVLRALFIDQGFTIFDALVSEHPEWHLGESDTHFRGRMLETVLNGSFNGLSEPDFRYGDLKLIETVADHRLAQVLTVGAIFAARDKSLGDYDIVRDYRASRFYHKVQQAIIASYRKVSRQLGNQIDSVFVFEADDPAWATQLQEDWLSIAEEMAETIELYRAGRTPRRKSGICRSDSSGRRRPHGYLGIRSDGVVFTKRFYEIISRHYAELDNVQ